MQDFKKGYAVNCYKAGIVRLKVPDTYSELNVSGPILGSTKRGE
jgi:hypothetical protein